MIYLEEYIMALQQLLAQSASREVGVSRLSRLQSSLSGKQQERRQGAPGRCCAGARGSRRGRSAA